MTPFASHRRVSLRAVWLALALSGFAAPAAAQLGWRDDSLHRLLVDRASLSVARGPEPARALALREVEAENDWLMPCQLTLRSATSGPVRGVVIDVDSYWGDAQRIVFGVAAVDLRTPSARVTVRLDRGRAIATDGWIDLSTDREGALVIAVDAVYTRERKRFHLRASFRVVGYCCAGDSP